MLKANTDFEVIAQDSHVKQDWIINDIATAVKGTDLVLILTDHEEYKMIGNILKENMTNPVVLDTKDIISNVSWLNYYNFNNISEI